MRRRVVITGLGAVSGLGIGIGPLWEGLERGRSALRPIRAFDASGFRARLGAEVEGVSARDFVPKGYRKAVKVMSRDIELAVAAAHLAARDAGMITREVEGAQTTYPAARTGCHIGAGLISAEANELAAALAASVDGEGRFDLRAWGGVDGVGGMANLPPLWMLKYLPNMLACHVTIIHGAEGPSNTLTCAEASGLLCIGEAARVIERGDADACFAGGAESPINLMRLLRWELADRLADTGDEEAGERVLRPFDPASRGGLMGEGGGIVILEGEDTARARGATAIAEVAGFGAAQSGDELCVAGEASAIRRALDDAGIGPDAVDLVIPRATGSPRLDRAEAEALRSVLGGRLSSVPALCLSPAVGECLAASGGLAVAAAARCLAAQRIPARIHTGRPEGVQAGPAPAGDATLRHVLVATAALGGQCAAVVLRRAG